MNREPAMQYLEVEYLELENEFVHALTILFIYDVKLEIDFMSNIFLIVNLKLQLTS